MTSVLITGSNGFIGSHLTDFFIEKDFEVGKHLDTFSDIQRSEVLFVNFF